MSNTNTGGRAFPAPTTKPLENYYPGMTLRDYFAAKAMQALMTAGYWNWKEPKEDSDRCYAMADAMLKAREA
jgi:hypothetical protein